MNRSESIISNLLLEIDLLTDQSKNINQTYFRTSHIRLRERLIYENKIISGRINEIFLIAQMLERRNSGEITFSKLLLEKCKRTINEKRLNKNLFFL